MKGVGVVEKGVIMGVKGNVEEIGDRLGKG